MNILHLVPDEKFIRFVDIVFRELPEVSNRFVAYVSDPKSPLKHIADLKLWRLVGKYYFFSKQMIQDLEWCDCLLIHYLRPTIIPIILKAPRHIIVVWSGWGADYYLFLPKNGQNLLFDETQRIVKNLHTNHSVRNVLEMGKIFLGDMNRKLLTELFILLAMKRIDLFSAPVPEDFELMNFAFGSRFRANYVQLNYGSVEQTFRPGPKMLIGKDILVGNSATATNNHIEVFKLLANKNLGNRKVIVPLSYGDPTYLNVIIPLGERLLGDRFEPITNFMPLKEYNTLIARCSIAIMNHRRQQALGNIGVMLYKGARVFLNEKNTIYQFLKKRGAHVFNICKLLETDDSILEPLCDEKKMDNQKILENLWGHNVVIKNAIHFVRIVKERRIRCE